MKNFTLTLTAAVALATALPVAAETTRTCDEVIIGNGGWSDNIVQDALVMNVLDGLGYTPNQKELGLSILMKSLATDDLDVHFDYWSPSSDTLVQPYVEKGEIDVVRQNLSDTKYTLAVPTYTWEAGLKEFADIASFKDELDGEIYSHTPGSDSGNIILEMIKNDSLGLGDFELKESSEQGMLSQVQRMISREKPIVFVGWAPHPMNTKYDIKYLSGGDDFFGPDFGSAKVFTITSAGYSERCPNLGQLLENVEFTVDMENELMLEVLENGADPVEAAGDWLKAHPEVVDAWLIDVEARDGTSGANAVKAFLAQ